MKRLLLPALFLIAGLSAGNDALGGGKEGVDKKKLVEEIDRRIDAKLRQFRRELLADIKELIAGAKKDREEEALAKKEDGGRKHAGFRVEAGPGARVEVRPEGGRRVEARIEKGGPGGKARVRIERDGKVWEKDLDLEKDGEGFDFTDPRTGDRMKVLKKVIPQIEKFRPQIEKFGREFGPDIEKFGKEWGPQIEKFGKRFGRQFRGFDPERMEKMRGMFKGRDGFDFEQFWKLIEPRGRRGDGDGEESEGPREMPEGFRKRMQQGPKGEERDQARRFVELRKEQPEKDRGAGRELDALKKQKDELAKELKEVKKLLEKLLRQRERGRDRDRDGDDEGDF